MRVLIVTLGSGATPIWPITQQAPQANICATTLVVQNNSVNASTLGDNTVSATKGIVLPGVTSPAVGIPLVLQFATARGSQLSQYYLFGTAGQTVTVMYETAQ